MVGEQDLVGGFLKELARSRVLEFINDVAGSDRLMAALCNIDLTTKAVTSFANANGYAFSQSDLEAVIEERIAAEIPVEELDIRARMIAGRDDAPVAVSARPDTETDAHLHDVVHAPGFELDRRAILSGDVVALRQVPALPTLLVIMDEVISDAFAGMDLEELHHHLDFDGLKANARKAYVALLADDRIPGAVRAIVEDLGFDPERTLWEWPGMRLLFPAEKGGRGVYRVGNTGALAAHRDTWYGSPQHQINLWGPIRRLDPDATLRIYWRYFRKRVSNNSRGYDVWQNRAGLALPPSIRESVSAESAFSPPLETGDVMCFAGHQLHASAVNRSGRTRVSFEFRLLCADDEGREYVPANIDYGGIGEIYTGWHDAGGTRLNRLTGKPDKRP